METAAFSLLLPVYAGDDPLFLREAFNSSVVGQSLCPAEVVIVRDGPVSRGLQRELLALRDCSPVPVVLVELPRNVGLARALNAGLRRVGYGVVARMDADDVSLPGRFARQWPLVEAGLDLVGAGMVEFESDPGVVLASRVPPVGVAAIRRHAVLHNPFNHPTMMFRVAAVERVGGYEEFGRMEDYWLGVRLLVAGARVDNVVEPLVAYRVGAGAFKRRGGFGEARTELCLQWRMLRIGFIGVAQFLRNCVVKLPYRLLPAFLRRLLFRGLVAPGLLGERRRVR